MAAMDSSDNGASSSDSNSGSFKATGRGRCRALRIFWEYPDLAKTTIGAGFLIACLLIGTPLVLNELKVQVWKKNMSSYGAAVQLLSGVVAVAFGGMFGRVSDRIDRRCAFCLCGLLVFMPWYALLLLPKNSTALYAWSALTIVSGATCMTISGCPMINTFVCDVAPVKERELAFGVATALAFAWTILCWVGAGAIAKQYPGEKEQWLTMQQLASFDAALLWPNDLHQRTFHEIYRMAMPLFMPDSSGLFRAQRMSNWGYASYGAQLAELEPQDRHPFPPWWNSFNVTPEVVTYWERYSDWQMPHVQRFSSLPGLIVQLERLDLHQTSAQMRAYHLELCEATLILISQQILPILA